VIVKCRLDALTLWTALLAAPSSIAQESAGAPSDFAGVYVAVYVGEPVTVIEPDEYPMTPAAREAYDAFDAFVSDPRRVDDCAPEKLPTLLWTANPVEFIVRSDRVEVRFEEGGSHRVIPLNTGPPPADQTYSPLGYSEAHWEDGALVVETTHLESPTIVNDLGYPLSRDAVLRERYWKEPGDPTLHLEFQVEDPVNYTETLEFSRIWGPSQTEQVMEWDCFSLGPRDTEAPDFDELTRMLEQLEP
jgi:hypothetical protein